MKRAIMLVVLAAAAALAVSVAPAAADGYGVTLTVTPNPIPTSGSVTFSGRLTDGGDPVGDAFIVMNEFDTPDCSEDGYFESSWADEGFNDGNGDYSFGPVSASVLDGSGQYYVQTWAYIGEEFVASSACVPLYFGNVGAKVDSVYLCYSTFQTIPGVWSADEAVALVKEGYWEPTAVDGNVDGGVNVGSYHLQCNVTPKGDGYVGDGGDWFGPAYASVASQELGFYPH